MTHLFFALTILLIAPGVLEAALRSARPFASAVATIVLLSLAVTAPVLTRSNWLIVLPIVVALLAGSAALLARVRDRETARTIVLAGTLLAAVALFGSVSLVPGFNAAARAAAASLAAGNRLVASVEAETWTTLVASAAGLVLVTVELNHPIALVLRKRRLLPDDAPGDGPSRRSRRGPDEAARGRVIGYLERAIVFVIIVAGTFESLGLVLVAKGIARFQQLQDRDFAEYFLIGTLLSMVAALAVGFAARALL